MLFNIQWIIDLLKKKSVLQTQRVHLFPFRTQKLSSAVVKILYGRLYGKIAQCWHRTVGTDKTVPRILKNGEKRNSFLIKWGCSSAGRAPALQAGGHGFESHHLHQAIKCHKIEEDGMRTHWEYCVSNTGSFHEVNTARNPHHLHQAIKCHKKFKCAKPHTNHIGS